jgi:hypothetical protein
VAVLVPVDFSLQRYNAVQSVESRRFRGTYSLRLQSVRASEARSQSEAGRLCFLRSVTSQNLDQFITAAVRISTLTHTSYRHPSPSEECAEQPHMAPGSCHVSIVE